MKNQITAKIKEEKIIAIIRHLGAKDAEALCEALYKGGIRLAEITFDPAGTIPAEETAKTISVLRDKFAGKMLIGAGTVLDMDYARIAIGAGAEFIISPNTDPDVIRYTKECGRVSIPGAMTPTEVVSAYRAGADFVKVFPSDTLGLKFIKALRAPLPHIPLIPTGGINTGNIADFLSAGAAAVGIGSNLSRNDLVKAGRLDEITALAEEYLRAANGGAAKC
ncbi:MAG: bifunctional 4-hydroxy-2-oxoglutarate aldolase/2-dehydro-3-deoxy-phosphogluconate aldolase [Firmicutes bacterium]|uniref:Bifunctional 4-hydroxy-2-oxoglutarate aldolase/2-dehydro-3-deoxy-phosphogluconate aldolase n=1 Tax=Candidatus Colimorpha enterica TaxID=3083063 RepID=A0AAE3FIJ5_9BACT|nr:bifunctional 4-hydroxy-2-oxoglutarate aldolase/2-dehydro-3-deoxy-phosphogluconate aldolase [Candidatus Colimorpha enterica]